jgi:SAM-dependent methyltransferase
MLGPLLARTVITASSLRIFDALKDGPRTTAEISALCGTDVTATDKLLRGLYGSKYLTWRRGRYKLTRMSRHWLLSRSAKSIHSAILHRKIDLRFMDFERYVQTGESRDFHRELESHEWVCYQQGQASQALLIIEEVLNQAPSLTRANRMLDLGGGHGLYSLAFCERYPNLQARVLDLAIPSPGYVAKNYSDSARERVSFEIADVRTACFENASTDFVFIANLMHHLDEPANRRLFQRVADALRPGGFVIALDLARADSVEMSEQVESLMDLYFGAASGGQLWTVSEIQGWQERSGLRPLPPITMRLLPCCKMQGARKPDGE